MLIIYIFLRDYYFMDSGKVYIFIFSGNVSYLYFRKDYNSVCSGKVYIFIFFGKYFIIY